MKVDFCKLIITLLIALQIYPPLYAQKSNLPDTTTFYLLSSSHIGVSAMAGAPLSLTFSQPVDLGSAKKIIISQGGAYNEPIGGNYSVLKGKWSYSNNKKTVLFTPVHGFASGILICVTIPASVKTITGIAYSNGKDILHFMVDDGVDYGHTTDSIGTIKTAGGNNIPLIISTPANAEKHPVLIFVHGGAWKGGTPSQSVAMLPSGVAPGYITDKLGIAIAGVAYRCIGSDGNFAKALSDIKDALQYLKEHAGKYNLDINRIGIWGESAGSPLASLIAQQDTSIKCFIGLNGMYDFVNDGDGKFGTGNSFGQETPEPAVNSAIFNIRPHLANTLLIHGNADRVISHLQSVQFSSAIKKAGGQSTLLIYDGEPHWYFYAPGGKYEISTLYYIKEHLIKTLKQ